MTASSRSSAILPGDARLSRRALAKPRSVALADSDHKAV